MKMNIPKFPAGDDYYSCRALEYCKADADVTWKMYERQRFIKWVLGKYEQAMHYDQNKCVPVFSHNIPITGHDVVIKLDVKYKEQLSKTPIQIHIYYNERKVVIINTRNGRCGIAKCHANDDFSLDVGVALAWVRYTKDQIPDYVMKCLEEDF